MHNAIAFTGRVQDRCELSPDA